MTAAIGVDLAGILGGRIARAEGGLLPNRVGYGEGCPLFNRLGGLGSVLSSPRAENGFWRFLKATAERSFLRGTICIIVPPTPNSGGRVPLSPRDLRPRQQLHLRFCM